MQKLFTILVSIMLFAVFVTPIFAQTVPVNPPQSQTTGTEGGESAKIDNPLGIDDPRLIIGNIIRAILGIVGSLALAVFIYGGFTWVISAGNEEKVKKGKDMITWASFGLVIIFFGYAIVSFLINAVSG